MFPWMITLIACTLDGVTSTEEASTGVAFITVDGSSGDNQIIVVPGANMYLSEDDVNLAQDKGLLNSQVAVCQFEISATTTLHALKLARSNGVMTILNPAPLPPKPISSIGNQSAGDKHWELLPELLATSDYCCPNETEALQLYDQANSNIGVDARGDCTSDSDLYLVCLDWMVERGVKYPLITLGSKGVMVLVRNGNDLPQPTCLPTDVTVIRQHKSGNEIGNTVLHIAAPLITDVVDTTGAGDCFVGSLAFFIACHPQLGLVEHIRRAIWVASQSVRKVGTQSSYSHKNELPTALFHSTTFKWPN